MMILQSFYRHWNNNHDTHSVWTTLRNATSKLLNYIYKVVNVSIHWFSNIEVWDWNISTLNSEWIDFFLKISENYGTGCPNSHLHVFCSLRAETNVFLYFFEVVLILIRTYHYFGDFMPILKPFWIYTVGFIVTFLFRVRLFFAFYSRR